ncbi:DEAD/DEAH box helicase [Bacillus sp. RG28]|uniref:DEAD/DEAH box helicase n=1 Tax=Gottfriedia endophytica TaxID=2820819 RepID=A0A940SKL1_9BACI|nr:DEAD/DEAH box helicase [Gottfriedia endophytica]MBP0727205.1 DEAD/DEAH box helicase [Gottfriedia endophytica]
MNKFEKLGVSEELAELLTELGITEPTPIQEKTIPLLFEGKDVIGQAQTGTGKTFAFLFPILEKLDLETPNTQALIVAPTRELAIQITAEAKKLVSDDVGVLAVYGGQDVDRQIRNMQSGSHLIIATPGRLLDHLRRGTISLANINFLVLDEADQMLHIGFLNEVEDIIRQTPKNRQTMLFSATMPDQIQQLAKKYMNHPVIVRVKAERVTLDEIQQLVIETTDRGKLNALLKAMKEENPFLAVIFCRTKRRANKLNEQLKGKGLLAEELHGDLTQAKREKVMKLFRDAKIQYLVATDVAARGIDVDGVTHVFNYDIPLDTESYIHRIGRTGRAGQTGKAISFITPKDFQEMRLIEKEIGVKIPHQRMEEKADRKSDRKEERPNRSMEKKKTQTRNTEQNRQGKKKVSEKLTDPKQSRKTASHEKRDGRSKSGVQSAGKQKSGKSFENSRNKNSKKKNVKRASR